MTILFCELVGFISETVAETMHVVTAMNAAFSCFDELMDKFNVYKVSFYLFPNIIYLIRIIISPIVLGGNC